MTRTKKRILIFIFIVVAVLIANYAYNDSKKDDYLECTLSNNKYSNYEETLIFRYMYGTLFRYERDEIVTTDDMENDLKVFENIKEEAPNYAYFDYDINTSDNKIYITTKIEAFNMQEFYDDYMTEKNITFTDSMSSVQKELESQDYTCKTYRK